MDPIQPPRSTQTEPHGRGAICLARTACLILALMPTLAPLRPARGEELVDISWVKRFQPIHGMLNRDEPSPVALTLRIDGQAIFVCRASRRQT